MTNPDTPNVPPAKNENLSTADLASTSAEQSATTDNQQDTSAQQDSTTTENTAPTSLHATQSPSTQSSESSADTQPWPPDTHPTATQTEQASTPQPLNAEQTVPMFPQGELQNFRDKWSSIQTGFVDDPRDTVQQADSLVAEVRQRLAQVFADERSKLENQWEQGDSVSTEDLRVALQRYRSFFDRLLSV